jgi:vancomycin resistance protein YoaR
MRQRSLRPRPTLTPPAWWDAISLRDVAARPAGGRASLLSRAARIAPRLILIVAITLLLGALAMFAFRATYSDRIYPSILAGDVDVGGMTVDQAVAATDRRAAEIESSTVTVRYGDRTWTPDFGEIGATVDVSTTIDEAYALGRDENPVSRLDFTAELLRDDQVVPLHVSVDRAALNRWFDRVDADIGQSAVDATIQVDGTNVVIRPDETGTVVDRDAATAILLDTVASLQPATIELPTRIAQPEVIAADLEEPAAALRQALAGPVPVVFEQRTWDLAPEELAPFIRVDVSTDGDRRDVRMSLARDELAAWLRDRFSGEVNRSPADARIAWRAGDGLVVLDPSVDGAALRADEFASAVEAGFFDRQGPVAVPVVVTKPTIDANNLDALNINSLLGRGDSNYGGLNVERDTNIEVATGYLNGTLVPPGEEFSFNGAIGEITKEMGYVESGVIVNGRASTDDGGGVCQVSTTVFRAAVFGGLPITDWAEHTQRLPVYERDGWSAGFDASILQWAGGSPDEWGDLKFENDTGGYLLVQAWTDYPYLFVEIYGNDDGREVDISDASVWEGTSFPPDLEVVNGSLPAGSMMQTEWPRKPAEAAFVMTVTYADGTVREQEFSSVYEGNGNVWTVSPDMAGQSPAA